MNTLDGQGLRDWLVSLGAADCAEALEAADIDLEVMRELSEADLRELGLTLGQRKRLLKGIALLQQEEPPAPDAAPARAERRQLSFVFCDLVGSTELARNRDAEDTATLLQHYHGLCSAAAERWGGRMMQQYGDGCLLVFGHPVVHEDDPARAVRAALDVVAEVAAAQPLPGIALRTRVAIATGRVVIGDLTGSQDPNAVAGETPNLAARLQEVAEPSSVVIAPSTRRLIGEIFELETRGRHALKGFAEPMEVWRVLGEREEPGEEGSLEGRLIGRDAEMATLRDAWSLALSGQPQIVTISGEPGIGKSWLTSSFAQELRESTPGMQRIRNFCVAFKTNSALHPFLAAIARLAGIRNKEAPDVVRRKLADCPALAAARTPDAVRLLAAEFGADDAEAPLDLNAAQRKVALFRLMVELLAVVAGEGPLLVEVEDVHWADPTSLELMRQMSQDLPALPILVLITHRPGHDVDWPAESAGIRRIALERLPLNASLAIAQQAVGAKPLPEARLRDIVAKADGVPLFLEELTRATMLMDISDVGGSLAVPDTLEDSLMARLSLLGDAKDVAQIAATIGRRVRLATLAAVTGTPVSELRTTVERLVAADILFPAEDEGGEVYIFSHALIQDAAYGSLLRSERRQLHATIAGILAGEAQGAAMAEPEVLARHYAGAEMPLEAVGKLIEAGQAATARAAQIEANNHYRAALELLEGAPDSAVTTRLKATVNALLGQSLLATVGFAAPEVGAAFERARALSAEIEDTALLVSSLYGVWVVAASRGERDKTLKLAAEAVELFGESSVPLFAMGAHFMDGVTQIFLGQLDRAEAALGRVLEHYSRDLHPLSVQAYGDDLGSYTLIYLLWSHALRGDFTTSFAYTEQNRELTEALGDKQIETRTLGFTMSGMQMLGEIENAQILSEKLIARATEQCYPYWVAVGQVGKGWVMGRTGQAEVGLGQFQAALGFLELIGQRTPLSLLQSYHADTMMTAGRHEHALTLLNSAIRTCEIELDALYLPDLVRQRGVCLARKDRAAGEAEIRRALAMAEARQMHFFALRAARSLREVLSGTPEEAEATQTLRAVRARIKSPMPLKFLEEIDALLDAEAPAR